MTSSPHLSAAHLEELRASVIADDVIAERGYRTATDPTGLPGAFAEGQRRPGLVVPIRDTTGQIAAWQLKADTPRVRGGKPIKYDTATGGRQCLDVPQRSRPHLGAPAARLWITEGAKKADSGLSHGIQCIIGVQGVFGWRGRNEHGGIVALPDWESVALNKREVVLAFDSDCMTKTPVRGALNRLSGFLRQRGAHVRFLILPMLEGGRKCGLDDAFAQGMTLSNIEHLIVDDLPELAPEWETPIPLDDPVGPPFSVVSLPGVIRDHVAAVAEETQTPPDLAANVALGTISAAAGGKYEVRIPEQGWTEPVHIMAVSAAEPGNRKTGIYRLMTRPIVEYERRVQPGERQAFAQWESRGRMLEKALSGAESAAGKAPRDGKIVNMEAVRMAAVDAIEVHNAERPRITRIITDDATPEAVKSLLAEQGGAIAAMSAESSFLSNTAGSRYADAPNLDVLLNGHAGDGFTVDRKGRSSESVDRACLTLCLMVQPQVIRDLGKAPGFITRGGAARILPSFPVDLLGRRRIDVTPVPPDLADAWSEVITRIVARRPGMHAGSYIPWSLRLANDALMAFRDYRAWHEPQMAKDGEFGDIRDWAGKQCGAALRIAGLLHVTQHEKPEDVLITADTLQRAISIVDYFADHARVMYRLMRGRSDHADARAVLAAIRRVGSPTTRREIHRKLHNRAAFATSDTLAAPLDLLEEYGYIQRERQIGDKGGRPTESISLNPSELDDRTDTTGRDTASPEGSVNSVIALSEHKPPPMPNVLEPTGTDGGLSDDDWEAF